MQGRRFPCASLATALLAAAAGAGCRVEGKVNASGAMNETRAEGEGDVETTRSTTTPPPPAVPATAPPAQVTAAAPSAPPQDACPITCFEARGSERATMTPEEQTHLRSALEPVLGRMRSCTSPEDWRRFGSPTINLRIAADGTLAELGVDPHHGSASSCFDQAGQGATATLALPGRKVVRCAERCVRETPQRSAASRAARPAR